MRPDPHAQAGPPFLHHLAHSTEEINMLASVVLTNIVIKDVQHNGNGKQ